MSVVDLAKLVDRMRIAQKKYFRTRQPEYLERSKQLEAEVDRAVGVILENYSGDLFSQLEKNQGEE